MRERGFLRMQRERNVSFMGWLANVHSPVVGADEVPKEPPTLANQEKKAKKDNEPRPCVVVEEKGTPQEPTGSKPKNREII